MNIHSFMDGKPIEIASGPIEPMSRNDGGYHLRIKGDVESFIISLDRDEVMKLVCWHEGRKM